MSAGIPSPARIPEGRDGSGSEKSGELHSRWVGRERVVLFGGYQRHDSGSGAIWEWNGTTWDERRPERDEESGIPRPIPMIRADAHIVYDHLYRTGKVVTPDSNPFESHTPAR